MNKKFIITLVAVGLFGVLLTGMLVGSAAADDSEELKITDNSGETAETDNQQVAERDTVQDNEEFVNETKSATKSCAIGGAFGSPGGLKGVGLGCAGGVVDSTT